jgi:WbqC-like protein family
VKLAIMQPYVFPYVGYYQLIGAVDRFVVSDDVTYIKQGWINRNRLLINGEAAYFTVPLKRAASTTLIRDMTIDDEGQAGWRRRLLKTVANYYRRTPCFGQVFPIVEGVFTLQTASMAEMARASLTRVCEYLGIGTVFVPSTQHGNQQLKGEARVIDTCLRESADRYINAIGGRTLYSKETFAGRGIDLSFLQSRPVEYEQFGGPFVPWLSIIDVLMFNGPEAMRRHLGAYDLV